MRHGARDGVLSFTTGEPCVVHLRAFMIWGIWLICRFCAISKQKTAGGTKFLRSFTSGPRLRMSRVVMEARAF